MHSLSRSSHRSRWPSLVALTLGLVQFTVAQSTAPRFEETYAIVGARIEIGDGRAIPKGTVLIRGDRILAVGADIKAPGYAYVVKGDGLTVYPGFIDGYVTSGMKIPQTVADRDVPPTIAESVPTGMRDANRKAVRPEVKAAEILDWNSRALLAQRKAGFTTAVFAPSGAVINGTLAMVNLSGLPARTSVVNDNVGIGLGTSLQGNTYPESLLGAYSQMRQTLMDAAAYQSSSGPRAVVDPSLAALQPLLQKEIPAVFEADLGRQIVRALRIGDQFGLRMIVSGAREAHKVADLLASKNAGAIVSLDFAPEPKPKLPKDAKETKEDPIDDPTPPAATDERQTAWLETLKNPAQLNSKGVLFAFTTQGTGDYAKFFANLRRAVDAGLPKQAALRALTIDAARLFGVDRSLGTVEAGKLANLTIMNGDFLDPKAKVQWMFVGGQIFRPETDLAPAAAATSQAQEEDHR